MSNPSIGSGRSPIPSVLVTAGDKIILLYNIKGRRRFLFYIKTSQHSERTLCILNRLYVRMSMAETASNINNSCMLHYRSMVTNTHVVYPSPNFDVHSLNNSRTALNNITRAVPCRGSVVLDWVGYATSRQVVTSQIPALHEQSLNWKYTTFVMNRNPHYLYETTQTLSRMY